jgi:hypothetical protein
MAVVFGKSGRECLSGPGNTDEKPDRGCTQRQGFIKKNWLYAFSYAQSRISLVFCRSPCFLVPWFSSLSAESDLADFLCYLWRRRWEDFICLFAKPISP